MTYTVYKSNRVVMFRDGKPVASWPKWAEFDVAE